MEFIEDFKCEECKETKTFGRVDNITIDNYLLMHVKRFNKHLDKLSDNMKAGDNINIGDKQFKLQAYVVHIGDTAGLNTNEFVHYIVCVKKGNQWILLDDNTIRVLS